MLFYQLMNVFSMKTLFFALSVGFNLTNPEKGTLR